MMKATSSSLTVPVSGPRKSLLWAVGKNTAAGVRRGDRKGTGRGHFASSHTEGPGLRGEEPGASLKIDKRATGSETPRGQHGPSKDAAGSCPERARPSGESVWGFRRPPFLS